MTVGGIPLRGRVVCYSAKQHGKSYVSPDFQIREFRSRDGADRILIDLRLVLLLQALRDQFRKPLIINSAYRTKGHNQKVGGSTNSQHLLGKAADIRISGVSSARLYQAAEKLLGDSGGLGLYKTFVHIDTRDTKARWTDQGVKAK